jgi:hypothetical protein
MIEVRRFPLLTPAARLGPCGTPFPHIPAFPV